MNELVSLENIKNYAIRNTAEKMPIESQYVTAFLDSLFNSTAVKVSYEKLKSCMWNENIFTYFLSYWEDIGNLNKEPYRSIIAYSMLKKDKRLFDMISENLFTGTTQITFNQDDFMEDFATSTDENDDYPYYILGTVNPVFNYKEGNLRTTDDVTITRGNNNPYPSDIKVYYTVAFGESVPDDPTNETSSRQEYSEPLRFNKPIGTIVKIRAVSAIVETWSEGSEDYHNYIYSDVVSIQYQISNTEGELNNDNFYPSVKPFNAKHHTDTGMYSDMIDGIIFVLFTNYYCDDDIPDETSRFQTSEELEKSMIDFNLLISICKPARVEIVIIFKPYCYIYYDTSLITANISNLIQSPFTTENDYITTLRGKDIDELRNNYYQRAYCYIPNDDPETQSSEPYIEKDVIIERVIEEDVANNVCTMTCELTVQVSEFIWGTIVIEPSPSTGVGPDGKRIYTSDLPPIEYDIKKVLPQGTSENYHTTLECKWTLS